jgi:hypothetical protein
MDGDNRGGIDFKIPRRIGGDIGGPLHGDDLPVPSTQNTTTFILAGVRRPIQKLFLVIA